MMIRHAPADTGGRLCGRTDVPVRPDHLADVEGLRRALPDPTRRVTSPALRCRQTAAVLWPGKDIGTDARLREQDFGDWDGLSHTDVPDLGPLSAGELARHRPPAGESFEDLCGRVHPALITLAGGGGIVAILAHAGTVRAALALALGDTAVALAFEIAPLSVTRLRPLPGGGFTVISTNCLPA